MCIGIPARIVALNDAHSGTVEINAVRREVDLSLVGAYDAQGHSRVGQWVLVHVGFAMSVIDERQAHDTLAGLQAVFDAAYLAEESGAEEGDNHALYR